MSAISKLPSLLIEKTHPHWNFFFLFTITLFSYGELSLPIKYKTSHFYVIFRFYCTPQKLQSIFENLIAEQICGTWAGNTGHMVGPC